MKTTRKNQLSRTIDVPGRQTSQLGFATSMLGREVGFGEKSLSDENQPLRVAQIAPAWLSVPPKNYGGTEAVISNLTEELVKQGHQVTLFASGDSRTSAELKSYVESALIDQGIPWHNHLHADYHLINSFREIELNASKYDIVHIHLSSRSDLFLLKLASQISVPHICTLHSRLPLDDRKEFIGLGDDFNFSFSPNTPMIAISDKAKLDAQQSGYPVNIIGVVPHGLPNSDFLQGKSPERSHLVWIGKICKNKGTKYAIEAAVKAKRKIIIAGVVDEYVSESVDYFKQEVVPLLEKYPEYAEFIGSVNNAQKIQLLQTADCFLNPIQWEEPFGLVMIEAMACGCPVIAFKRGAANQLIKPGINGDFAASVDEMAAMIESVTNSINREKMVLDTWNSYSVTQMAKNYVSMYQKVINPQKTNLKKSEMYALSAN